MLNPLAELSVGISKLGDSVKLNAPVAATMENLAKSRVAPREKLGVPAPCVVIVVTVAPIATFSFAVTLKSPNPSLVPVISVSGPVVNVIAVGAIASSVAFSTVAPIAT